MTMQTLCTYVIRYGKKYRKLNRDEIIKEGDLHSCCCGELQPIVGIDTIGDKPASFRDEREFYRLIL